MPYPRLRSILTGLCACLLFPLALFAQSPPPPSALFRFAGFGDLDARHSLSSGHNFFDGAELDLYCTSRWSDRWSALGEVLLQNVRDGEDVDGRLTRDSSIDLERLYLAYSRSDLLRIEAGEVATGLIRWNEREHRGRFLQTSIDVPAMARREEQGGPWPLHFVGLVGSGRSSGPLGISYSAGVGEGRGKVRDEIQPLTDSESTPAGIFTIGFEPDRVPGLQFGTSVYRGEIPSPEGHLRELDRTAYGSYASEGVEIRGEWSRMNHSLTSDGHTFTTTGWYLLASSRLKGSLKKLRPYILLDHLSLPEDEQYLADVREVQATAAGVRWDVASHVALKFDLRAQKISDAPVENLFRVQVAFYF